MCCKPHRIVNGTNWAGLQVRDITNKQEFRIWRSHHLDYNKYVQNLFCPSHAYSDTTKFMSELPRVSIPKYHKHMDFSLPPSLFIVYSLHFNILNLRVMTEMLTLASYSMGIFG